MSGTEDAKQKFMRGVENTRAAPEDTSKQAGSMAGSGSGDNPKAGGSMLKSLAKGDTNASNYDPKKGPST
ncbi:hypothetical protein F5B20DRAFT_323387, partial [Whalleya microplaca]